MGWSVSGLIFSGIIAFFAHRRSRAEGGFYDADIYGMTAGTHRAYAVIAALFFVAFGLASYLRAGTIAVWIFAPFVLFALFYLTSFLRGAHEDDG